MLKYQIAEEMQKNVSPECTSHEAGSTTSDSIIQQEQNMLMKETLEADDHDAEMASVEGALSEARPRDEDLGRDDDESPQEEQSDSMNTINEAPQITLLDSSTPENELINELCSSLDHEEIPTIHESAEDEAKNECPSPDHEEKKPMINESGSGDDTNSTICVDQEEIESGDPIIEAELKENGDESLEENAEEQDENGEANRNELEKALHGESEPLPTENGHETEMEATEKCVTELRSSEGIDTAEVETPPISTEYESKTNSGPEILETEANQSNNGAKAELRKSPSFDFGISFDTRSEDSDQTPLLYQDKTARRSLSTCSNLSFQSTSIQKEYAVKPLQFEAVQVEEKTIQMERSNSKTPPPPPQAKNIQENGSNASPSKGNGRRKTRSSLFTTCICCTAAIS